MANENITGKVFKILKYPNPELKKIAEPVEKFDDELAELVKNLFATMHANDGVGLAATQVGIEKRVAVVEYKENSYVLINPRLISTEGEQEGEEGCLSFPGIYAKFKRPMKVKIEAQDVNGNKNIYEAEGYTARAFVHEMDHLDGKVFIDYLSNFKQGAIKKKLIKNTGGHF